MAGPDLTERELRDRLEQLQAEAPALEKTSAELDAQLAAAEREAEAAEERARAARLLLAPIADENAELEGMLARLSTIGPLGAPVPRPREWLPLLKLAAKVLLPIGLGVAVLLLVWWLNRGTPDY